MQAKAELVFAGICKINSVVLFKEFNYQKLAFYDTTIQCRGIVMYSTGDDVIHRLITMKYVITIESM